MKSRRNSLKSLLRRGSVIAPSVIFGASVGVGMAALAVDTGLMFNAKQELRNAADAAALAGASQLGDPSATTESVQEAARLAGLNSVTHQYADLLTSDVKFGRAVPNGARYDFFPDQTPYNAVNVRMRRDQTVADGPISLLFARSLGVNSTDMSASATAMVVPRDMSVVIDLSGSMNDDSELRHYKDFVSENDDSGEIRPGVQINLEAAWMMLPCTKGNNGVGNGIDPQPPGNPSNYNDQPGTGPGSPNSQGGNTSPGANPTGPNGACGGPRWGWMTGFGNAIVLGAYTPIGDPGLYYIPRNLTCYDSDVSNNLTEAGYTLAERTALLSGTYDSDMTLYRNRVKVCVGLAGWKSKKSPSKYHGGSGNGDNKVETNELTQEISWPWPAGGSWDNYIDYMTNTSEMRNTDTNFRYRYGIKTITNYLLEKQNQHSKVPELAACPEQPLKSVKDAVQVLVDTLVEQNSDDHLSLEVFAQYGTHRVNLTTPDPLLGQTLAQVLQLVPNNLKAMQSGHFTSITNIGVGLNLGITELTSSRARPGTAKVIVLMTDGKPNTDSSGNYVGNNAPSAVSWCQDRADKARAQNMGVYVIGVGGDVDASLCTGLASNPDSYFFADSAPDPNNNNQPLYISQLGAIFRAIANERPVRLIQ